MVIAARKSAAPHVDQRIFYIFILKYTYARTHLHNFSQQPGVTLKISIDSVFLNPEA
jgi:hypothetical protein